MADPHAIQARACAQGITTNSEALAIKKPRCHHRGWRHSRWSPL